MMHTGQGTCSAVRRMRDCLLSIGLWGSRNLNLTNVRPSAARTELELERALGTPTIYHRQLQSRGTQPFTLHL